MALPSFHPITLQSKRFIARDILELRFNKPPDFDFRAGQFVQFAVADKDQTVWRSYSISSSPDKDYLEFCTKLIPGGKASDKFTDLAAGETAMISLARGVFVLDSEDNPIVLVATGTGIAPLAAMLDERLPRTKSAIHLIFGVRAEADIFWRERFVNLTHLYPNFNFILTLSNSSVDWSGKRGRVTDYLEKISIPGAHYYLCGNVEMVKDARQILLQKSVDTKSIHFEIY